MHLLNKSLIDGFLIESRPVINTINPVAYLYYPIQE